MIISISISNIYGTREAAFSPGQCTIVTGSNGSGKSSILRGLAIPFTGGTDPARLRIGAEKGHVRIGLDDGSQIEYRIWIKKTKDGSKGESSEIVEYKNKDGIILPGPAALIAQLGDKLAVDPAKLLACDVTTAAGRKALSQAILDVMPVSFCAADLDPVIKLTHDNQDQPGEGAARARAVGMMPQPVDLAGLRRARQALEETRRTVGVDQRQASAAVDELRRGIPAEQAPGDIQAQLEAAEQEASNIRASIMQAQSATKEEANAARLEEERSHAKQQAAILTAERESLQQIEDDHVGRESAAAVKLVELRQLARSIDQAEGARKQVEILAQTAKAKTKEYDILGRAMEMLDQIKAAKLAESAIPGLTVDDDGIKVDGVPWQSVNTARRVETVVQLCAMRAGKLPFLMIDDAEHMDRVTWDALSEALTKGGFQVVAAFVQSDQPLTISTAEHDARTEARR